MRRRYLLLIVFATLAVAAGALGCGKKEIPKTNGKKDDKVVVPVEVAAVTKGTISRLTSPGPPR